MVNRRTIITPTLNATLTGPVFSALRPKRQARRIMEASIARVASLHASL